MCLYILTIQIKLLRTKFILLLAICQELSHSTQTASGSTQEARGKYVKAMGQKWLLRNLWESCQIKESSDTKALQSRCPDPSQVLRWMNQ